MLQMYFPTDTTEAEAKRRLRGREGIYKIGRFVLE